jgi:hypothetical protein
MQDLLGSLMRFRRRAKTPVAKTIPIGSCIVTKTGTYLIHRDGKKYLIPTQRVLDSWSFPLVLRVSQVDADKIPTAKTRLGFRDGTLLHNISDGKIYLVSESTIRHITDHDILTSWGLNKGDAVVVSQKEINLMREGIDLT